MTFTQFKFRRKLIGFGGLLIFCIFAVLGFSVLKVVAQTQETAIVESSAEQMRASEKNGSDPGVVKYAFLAASIAVGFFGCRRRCWLCRCSGNGCNW